MTDKSKIVDAILKEAGDDPVLDQFLRTDKRWQQVQYSTAEQLDNLQKLAIHFGLYDAANFLKRARGHG